MESKDAADVMLLDLDDERLLLSPPSSRAFLLRRCPRRSAARPNALDVAAKGSLIGMMMLLLLLLSLFCKFYYNRMLG